MAYTKAQIAFHEYVMEDLLAGLEDIRSRKMFGGYGIYQGPYIFGLIVDETLFIKVDDSNRADFEALGSEPFVYERKDHPRTVMSYYELPESIADNPEELEAWVDKAVQVSMRAKRKKPKKTA